LLTCDEAVSSFLQCIVDQRLYASTYLVWHVLACGLLEHAAGLVGDLLVHTLRLGRVDFAPAVLLLCGGETCWEGVLVIDDGRKFHIMADKGKRVSRAAETKLRTLVKVVVLASSALCVVVHDVDWLYEVG